jgi:hypothetical protein
MRAMTIEHEHETVPTQTLERDGEPCAYCGAALAGDQRYCLNCGRRRAELETPFAVRARETDRQPARFAQPGPPRAPIVIAGRPVSPAALGAGLGIFVVALLLGILIGNGGDGGKQVAAAPQVIKVSAPAAAAPAQPAAFTSDWPSGKDGYTVQLQTLSKVGAQPDQVEQAKAAAQSKGAAGVGALDSDEFASLDPGNYVIYSGVFATRRQAAKALKRLKGRFPGARAVKVSSSGGGSLSSGGDPDALSGKKKEATVGKKQLEQLKKLSPDKYQNKSRKLPDTTKLPGKAPPKDKKKPGGGGGGQTIG